MSKWVRGTEHHDESGRKDTLFGVWDGKQEMDGMGLLRLTVGGEMSMEGLLLN